MIRREAKRVWFDFIMSKCQILVNITFNRVQPITIIPNMKILFIFSQKHFNQIHLRFDHFWIDGIQSFHEPLPIAPNCIRFRIRLNQLGCKLNLSRKYFTNLLSYFICNRFSDELATEVEDSGNVCAKLHEKCNKLKIFRHLWIINIGSGNGEELL